MTVAAFMDLALYDPRFGYYARAVKRSGRSGDFFTSVDVGEVFGELLSVQIAEMAAVVDKKPFDLVEAGAGTGQLSADIMRALRRDHPSLYGGTNLHLIEASAAARAVHTGTLGDARPRLAWSGADLPVAFEGVLIANELLDALPVHQVVMREEGLRENYVTAQAAAFTTVEGPPSTPELSEYLSRLHATLDPGWRAEINLRALDWIREAARRLTRGFMIVIDYGHEARELYSVTHSGGTLTTFSRHVAEGPESSSATESWLRCPGEQDITAHVDFTSVRAAAEAAGLTTLGLLDQTYFLMGLIDDAWSAQSADGAGEMKRRLALKTLLMPGGLGSTMKVLILGKNVGTPALRGYSYRMRLT